VRNFFAASRRAQRLAKWYPSTWRTRYGAEFVDLMEQDLAVTPRSMRRTFNIVHKGLVTRLRDVGVVSPVGIPEDQGQVAVATIFVISSIFTAIALNFWSVGMLNWNGYPGGPASVAVTIWTGVITVAAGILVVLIVSIFCALLWIAVRRLFIRKVKGTIGPLSLIVLLVAFLTLSIQSMLRYVISSAGIDWAHPGQAIKQIAGAANILANTIDWIWTNPLQSLRLETNIVYGCIPIALVALTIALAALVRRIDFSDFALRLVRLALVALSSMMVVFILGYVGLIVSIHTSLGYGFGPPTGASFTLGEFGLMTFMAVLGARIVVRNLRHRNLPVTDEL